MQIGSGAAVLNIDGLATAGGRVVFTATTAPGIEKFSAISAASPGGPVVNLCPNGCGTFTAQSFLVSLGSHAVFATAVNGDSDLDTLWSTDGTRAGTLPFVDPGSTSVFDLVATGGSLYYFSFAAIGGSSGLMRSDGTAAGTVELGSFVGSPGGITPFSNGIAFSADDGSHGASCGGATARPAARGW